MPAPDDQPKTRALRRQQARTGGGSRPSRTLRVRIHLAYTDPPVERLIYLASDLRLDQVHRIIQAGFDWGGGHLHEFTQGEQRWDDGSAAALGPSPFDDGPGPQPERRTRLAQVLARVGDHLEYTYDFGDSWLHVLTVEEVLSREPGDPRARLVTAERAAPPDDCGGVGGYEDLVAALADPDNPEHAEFVDWVSEALGIDPADFDPAYVDLADLDRRVRIAAG